MSNLWHRLLERFRRGAIQREIEREQMSPSERRLAGESIEDLQAERFAEEHLGGIEQERPER